jgi:TolB-like protein
LWFIGLPASYVENQLALQLELVEAKTMTVLWQQSFNRDASELSILYAMQPDFMYDNLLKDIMKEAIPSLRNKLRSSSTSP